MFAMKQTARKVEGRALPGLSREREGQPRHIRIRVQLKSTCDGLRRPVLACAGLRWPATAGKCGWRECLFPTRDLHLQISQGSRRPRMHSYVARGKAAVVSSASPVFNWRLAFLFISRESRFQQGKLQVQQGAAWCSLLASFLPIRLSQVAPWNCKVCGTDTRALRVLDRATRQKQKV